MYVFVLATTSVVVLMGLTGLAVVRARAAAVELAVQADRARCHARSAMELAACRLAEADWRDALDSSGNLVSDLPLGDARITITASDPVDGDLGNGDSDIVELTATASAGRARQMYRVRFEPILSADASLSLALLAGGAITFTNAVVDANADLASNASINAVNSTITANVRAVGAISGGSYRGATTAGAAAFAMPDAGLFDAWERIATPIDDPPSDMQLDGFILAPGMNTFGTPSVDGIYLLDCDGRQVSIQSGRLFGTLILRNVGAGSALSDGVLIGPAEPGRPTLLIEGSFSFSMNQLTLSESSEGINFNPAGAPYQGVADADTSDTYTGGVEGLAYVSGDATVDRVTRFVGPLIVGGALTIRDTPSFASDPRYAKNPPIGFGTATGMRMVDGTWRRIVE